MSMLVSTSLGLVVLASATTTSFGQFKPEVIERGKKATALVEITTPRGLATGSAFCVDRSGLFITNAHVVDAATGPQDSIRLVVDIGEKTQRSLRARVYRSDDAVDLALLKVDGETGLSPLELAEDGSSRETEPVVTFGFPFGHRTTVRGEEYPDISVIASRITSLRRYRGRLEGIQFDGQLNPGNSGGPVLDGAGRVVGVAVATVPGAALNLAIPVNRLAEFLAAPGLDFNAQPLTLKDLYRLSSWTIRLLPPRPSGRLPDDVSVHVMVENPGSDPRSFTAQPSGDGIFRVTLAPAQRPTKQVVILDIRLHSGRTADVAVTDHEVSAAGRRFLLSELRMLDVTPSPRVITRAGVKFDGAITGLGKPRVRVGGKLVAIDLNEAVQITVRPVAEDQPLTAIDVRVEARQGTTVLATLRHRLDLSGAPARPAMPAPAPPPVVAVPAPIKARVVAPRGPSDTGVVQLGGRLDVIGEPRGGGVSIRPPAIPIGEATLGDPAPVARRSVDRTVSDRTVSESARPASAMATRPAATRGPGNPVVRPLDGKIRDVAVGGGGRYLILTLNEARQVAVFDVNAADVVKKIILPSENALVAAGARQVLIAFPDQAIVQRFDLDALNRPPASFASPIKARWLRMAMGSDSDGPLLVAWTPHAVTIGQNRALFSFVDAADLKVLKAGELILAGYQRNGWISPSGGTFAFNFITNERVHVRASGGGNLFGIWSSQTAPSGFNRLAVRHSSLEGCYEHMGLAHLAPGPDGCTFYTGRGGVIDSDGRPLRGSAKRPNSDPEMTVPSPDPAYYLRIFGLLPTGPLDHLSPRTVAAAVHAADDGERLLTIHGLDEMGEGQVLARYGAQEDFTVEKRFHLIPAASLLITIPSGDDRLVLRRLDLKKSLDRTGHGYFLITSRPSLHAKAGERLSHQITGISRAGGLRYTLTQGPDGLAVSSDGRLSWVPPKEVAGSDPVAVVVTVSDSSSRQRFHTIRISVD
jgi:Trypsin-like peptidase domain